MNQSILKKIILFLLFAGGVFLSTTNSFFVQTFAQAQSVQEISGSLLSVDPVEKTVVIKYLIGSSSDFEAELFNVKEETRILKQGIGVGFSEVKVGASGMFSFSIDSEGKKNLVSMNLN